MNKLLYSLILSILFTSSLSAVGLCAGANDTYTVVGNKLLMGVDGTRPDTYYCSAIPSQIAEADFFYFDYTAVANTNNLTGYAYVSSCPIPLVRDENGLCYNPPVGEEDDNEDGVPNKCDPDYEDYDNQDCNGDGIPNAQDPDETSSSEDGTTPNKCNPDWDNFKGADCDSDGKSNWSDEDLDGDGLDNEYDNNAGVPLTGDEREAMPTCEEIRVQEEQNCFFGQHKFKCYENNGVPNVQINQCANAFNSPCDDLFDSVKSKCGLGYQVEGNCVDNGVSITSGDILCLPIPDSSPLCRATAFEELDALEENCVCIDGFTRNSFGRCWKSNVDSNSTSEEIAQDNQAQAEHNEALVDKEKQDKQQQADNNLSAQTALDLKTTNDTLKGIRGDLNSTNDLLKKMNDQLDANASTSGYYEDKDQEGNRLSIDGSIENIIGALDGINTDYNNLISSLDGGLNDVILTVGTSPQWCTTVFNKPFCINLCDSFGLFRDVFYYIFTLMFMLTSIKIYYTAFKMR